MPSLDELVQREIARQSQGATPPSPRAGSNSDPWTCPNCRAVYQPEGGISARRRYQDVLPDGRLGCEACVRAAYSDLVRRQQMADGCARFGLLNEEYQAMTLARYRPVTPEQVAAKTAAQEMLERWQRQGLTGRASLVLWSPLNPPAPEKPNPRRQGFGVGKTMLCVALLQEAVRLGYSVGIEKMNDLLAGIRDSYQKDCEGPSEAVLVNRVREAQVALLDDLGTEHVKADGMNWYRDIIYRLIDHAYSARHALLITTNLEPVDLANRIGERAASRLFAMCPPPIKVLGPDGRQRISQA